MYWDVKTVKPLPDFRIYVEIEDGRKGIFDLKPYLDHGVFRELLDVHYFNQVGIVLGAVTWPHEQDIASGDAACRNGSSRSEPRRVRGGRAKGGAPLNLSTALIFPAFIGG
jgi:hypothetical protein